MQQTIRKYALQNALKFNGKANPGNIIGKVLGDHPELRTQTKMVMEEINKIVIAVNQLSLEQQETELKQTAPELLDVVSTKRVGLQEFKTKADKYVLRFEPSPSGPLHIGHAFVLGLNAEYARKYNAKLYLRISDTNSDNIYPAAYEMIPQDANWITNNRVDEVLIQSDRMELYYDYAKQFIEKEVVYICTCSSEAFKELVTKTLACPCRDNPAQENLKRWHAMFTTYKEGDAVMRFKSNLKHKNPAMRDFPLMRINESEHTRQGKKYRVWPLMNFAVTVDDHDTKITHILRGKDHVDNAARQEIMFKEMGWHVPETLFFGRINFADMDVSCSKTRKLIEEGFYEGWEDIRLPFLLPLRNRGYMPEAFVKYAQEMFSLADKTVSADEFFKTLNAFNKDIIDQKANRYFFISNPKEITIENAPELTVELDLHPDHRSKGRFFRTKNNFFITDDLEEGKIYRLMDLLNFVVKDGKYIFHSTAYEEVKGKCKVIHWLPHEQNNDHNNNVEILMPDNTTIKGYGESHLDQLEVGDIVHFVRFGFCKLHEIKDDAFKFHFTHN